MQGLISFIIPVRDRENFRIQNCIDSIRTNITGEIIVIDYGSKIPIANIPGVKIIRYDGNKIWNKSHAINLGIQAAQCDYIGTVDCDMIVSSGFMEGVERHLDYNTFIYSIDVKRIELEYVSGDFMDMMKHATDWNNKKGRYNIIHNANGGVQIYPREWITSIGGADESLIYWGGMDNDVFERAIVSGLIAINLNRTLLHQEHEFKKEKQLDKKERLIAIMAKAPKIEYLNKMLEEKIIVRNDEKWGLEEPNQDRFLMSLKEVKAEQRKFEEKQKRYNEAFIDSVQKGKRSFLFDGKEVEIFK